MLKAKTNRDGDAVESVPTRPSKTVMWPVRTARGWGTARVEVPPEREKDGLEELMDEGLLTQRAQRHAEERRGETKE